MCSFRVRHPAEVTEKRDTSAATCTTKIHPRSRMYDTELQARPHVQQLGICLSSSSPSKLLFICAVSCSTRFDLFAYVSVCTDDIMHYFRSRVSLRACSLSFKMQEVETALALVRFLCLLFSLPFERGDATVLSSLALRPVRGRVCASPALRSWFFFLL